MKVTTNSKLIQLCMLAALLLLPASLFSSVKYDVVVAQDGTGDYCTVQAAVDAAPANRTAPWTIYIKPGVYVEHVDIPANKPFLSLVGESRDRVRKCLPSQGWSNCCRPFFRPLFPEHFF